MPRSPRSSNSSRRPWWLVLLVMLGGWVYNTYFTAPRQQTPRQSAERESTPRTSTSRKSSSRSTPRETMEGGKLISDVVTKVYDGDTVTLQRTGSIRLIGVDCPERKQQGGEEAGEFARHALLNKTVEVELCAKQPYDRYGRGLGFIYINDARGRRVLFNSEMVRAGYARVYSLRPCTVDEAEWNGYYEEARAARRGLFASLGEVPNAAAYRKSKR
jgi:endonuclease YncB( thermonuclease family)